MTAQEHVIYQLITPLILAISAGGFWAVWFSYRHMKAAGLWALAYSLGALGYLTHMLHAPLVPAFEAVLPRGWGTTVVTGMVLAMFLTGLWLFVSGVAFRFNRPLPLRVLAIVTGIIAGLIVWNLVVAPNTAMRTLVACFGCALILSTTLFMVPREARPIDHAILGLVSIAIALFAALPFVLPTIFGAPFGMLLAQGTPVGSALQFVVSASALGVGMVLFVALGMDIITELQHRSDTDGLTGVRNRLAFEIAAKRAIADGERHGRTLSLVVGDIDLFKSVNDTYGHAQGDLVIRLFANVLTASCRKADVVGRIGGEELCLLLPTATGRIGHRAADKARNLFAIGGGELMGGARALTASFGVAEWRAGESYEELFARADAALYEAKEGGRNRVRLAGVAATADRRGEEPAMAA